ncbi:MAG: hypothetical protein E7588_00910 [Ruminococcaceae bacterium]|nr:hypothetical protein [Oscillospiraceae bacterium]
MKVYGHRGASLYAPQNTLASFEMAFKMGAYGVENDVRCTADGEIVVMHNGDTMEMCGVKLIPEQSTLAELKALDIIDKNGNPTGQKIPTLGETYELMKKYPETHINVELKSAGEVFLKKVLEVTEKYKMTHRVIYSTFNAANLEWLHANRPDIPTAFLNQSEDFSTALKYGCVAIHPHQYNVTPEYVKAAHEANLEINVWTVDAVHEINKMIELGVDGIISDCPNVAMDWIALYNRK